MPLSEHVYRVAITFKMTEYIEQRIASTFVLSLIIPPRKYSDYSEGCSSQQLMIGSIITTTHPLMHQHSRRVFWKNIKSLRWFSLPTAQTWHSVTSGFSQNQKSPLKRKRFQTIDKIDKIQGQLRAIERTEWGSKVPTLKGTEVLLSYIQCFLYLVSSLFFILHGWIPSGQTSYI